MAILGFLLLPDACQLAWHHNDENGLGNISEEPKRIQDVHNLQVEVVREWVEEFYRSKKLKNH